MASTNNEEVFLDADDSTENIERCRRDKKRKPNSGEEEASELTELKNEMRCMRDCIDKMCDMMKTVCSRMDRFEERFVVVEKKLDKQSEDVDVLRKGLTDMEEKMQHMEDKLIDQEARSRRNNLVFHGVREDQGEDCARTVSNIISQVCSKADSDRIVIERAHRLGRVPAPQRRGAVTPRPLIVRFLDYNDRERVRGARRNLPRDVKVTEDLPWQIRQARGSLNSALEEARRKSRDAWITYPARLIVDGKLMKEVRPASMKRQSPRHQHTDGSRVSRD